MDCTRLLRTQTMASLSSPTTIGCISNLIEATECIYNTHRERVWVVVFLSLFFTPQRHLNENVARSGAINIKYTQHSQLFFFILDLSSLWFIRDQKGSVSLSLIDSTCMEGHSLAILTLSRCCCCCCCPRAKGAFRLPNIFFGSRFFIFSPSFQRDGLDSSSYFVFSSTVH
jgi:hypothetical protein